MANLSAIMSTEEREKYGHLLMDVDTNIKLGDVILSDENVEKVSRLIREVENAELLRSYGLEPKNKIMLYGASGCGKTFLAKALSNHLDYYMLYVDIGQGLSDETVSKSITDVFRLANKYKHCLIFFDECDSIAWNRDAVNGEGGIARRATNSIFQCADQMDPTNILVAATNMLHRLDKAFENRFNEKLEFRLPELDIEETTRKFTKSVFNLEFGVDAHVKSIITKRCRLSYRELREVVDAEMKRAVLDGDMTVKLANVYRDVAAKQKIKIQFHNQDDYESSQ